MFYIYAVYIGDGYADIESPVPADGDRPEEGSGYWYSYRHAEVTCPCDGWLHDGPIHDCPVCGGSGVAQGEPFTVTRYAFSSEADAERVAQEVKDAGDGYERAAVLAEAVRRGDCTAVDVLEWDTDHASEIRAHLAARDTEEEGV